MIDSTKTSQLHPRAPLLRLPTPHFRLVPVPIDLTQFPLTISSDDNIRLARAFRP